MRCWKGGIWCESISDGKSTYFTLETQYSDAESIENRKFFEHHHHLLALYASDCWMQLRQLHLRWWDYCKWAYNLKNPILGQCIVNHMI